MSGGRGREGKGKGLLAFDLPDDLLAGGGVHIHHDARGSLADLQDHPGLRGQHAVRVLGPEGHLTRSRMHACMYVFMYVCTLCMYLQLVPADGQNGSEGMRVGQGALKHLCSPHGGAQLW